MAFQLGAGSLRELQGVKPQLVAVVQRAIAITTQDFAITDGLRTAAEQAELMRRGATRTLDSKHLTGDAVDAVPYINGKPRWEWPPTYPVAAAFRAAAVELGVRLRWGGVWDRSLNDLPATGEELEAAVKAHVTRRKRAGQKSVFIDGPHFELSAA